MSDPRRPAISPGLQRTLAVLTAIAIGALLAICTSGCSVPAGDCETVETVDPDPSRGAYIPITESPPTQCWNCAEEGDPASFGLTDVTLVGSRAGRFEVLFTYRGDPTEIPTATTCEGCTARYSYPYGGLVLLAITAQGPWTATPIPRRPDSIRELTSTEEWITQ